MINLLIFLGICILVNVYSLVYLCTTFLELSDKDIYKNYKWIYFNMIIALPFHYVFSKEYRNMVEDFKSKAIEYKELNNE